MKRTGWLVACLVLTMPARGITAAAQPPSKATLIHYCRALYLGEDEAQGDPKLADAQRAARLYFRARTGTELSRQLVPLRKSLHSGTYSYIAVAYVLAYYGVDVSRNVKRICTTLDTPSSTRNPKTEQDRKEIEQENAPDEDLGHDNAVDAIRRVYEQHPSDTYWVAALRAWEKGGSVSEAPPGQFAEAFLRHPASMLRAAIRVKTINDDPSIVWLADSLNQYGYDPTNDTSVAHPQYTRARAAIRRLRRNKDLAVASAARALGSAFEREIRAGP